jgi:hypothetical protein
MGELGAHLSKRTGFPKDRCNVSFRQHACRSRGRRGHVCPRRPPADNAHRLRSFDRLHNANRRTTIPPLHRENRGGALRNRPRRLSSQQVSTHTLLRGQRRCRRRKWVLRKPFRYVVRNVSRSSETKRAACEADIPGSVRPVSACSSLKTGHPTKMFMKRSVKRNACARS